MSIQEILQEKLLKSVTEYGVITGVEKWENEIEDLKIKVINNYLEIIIKILVNR